MEVSHFPTKGVTILHLPDPKPGVLPSPEQAAWSQATDPPPGLLLLQGHRATFSEHHFHPITFCCSNALVLTPRLQTQLQPLSLVAKTPASRGQLILVVSSSTPHGSSVLVRWAVLLVCCESFGAFRWSDFIMCVPLSSSPASGFYPSMKT